MGALLWTDCSDSASGFRYGNGNIIQTHYLQLASDEIHKFPSLGPVSQKEDSDQVHTINRESPALLTTSVRMQQSVTSFFNLKVYISCQIEVCSKIKQPKNAVCFFCSTTSAEGNAFPNKGHGNKFLFPKNYFRSAGTEYQRKMGNRPWKMTRNIQEMTSESMNHHHQAFFQTILQMLNRPHPVLCPKNPKSA
jgi:hypothetical protein